MRITGKAIFIVWVLVMVVLTVYAYAGKASPPGALPGCTNTSIDHYYNCQPTAPLMIRKR